MNYEFFFICYEKKSIIAIGRLILIFQITTQRKLPLNPREKANILSKIFMIWTLPFFRNFYKKNLEFSDLYQPLTYDKFQTLGDRLEQWVWEKIWSIKTEKYELLFLLTLALGKNSGSNTSIVFKWFLKGIFIPCDTRWVLEKLK